MRRRPHAGEAAMEDRASTAGAVVRAPEARFSPGQPPSVALLLHLQRSAGNRATTALARRPLSTAPSSANRDAVVQRESMFSVVRTIERFLGRGGAAAQPAAARPSSWQSRP